MTDVLSEIRGLVRAMEPCDDVEAAHLHRALDWLGATDDVWRLTSAPTMPSMHLVSYFLVVQTDPRLVLLGAHRKSGLWLPSGGHVEPGEHPLETVRRECREELAVDPRLVESVAQPALLTVTDTVVDRLTGEASHTDVSLWFVVEVDDPGAIVADPGEYDEVRWWRPEEVCGGDPAAFDPHMVRMLDVLGW